MSLSRKRARQAIESSSDDDIPIMALPRARHLMIRDCEELIKEHGVLVARCNEAFEQCKAMFEYAAAAYECTKKALEAVAAMNAIPPCINEPAQVAACPVVNAVQADDE